MNAEAWSAARRILCVRLDTIGDVLMLTPAMRALRDAAPGRSLTLLTSPQGAEIARLIPELDAVIEYEAPWMKATALGASPTAAERTVARLRAGRFDAAAIFTSFSQSPLPAAMLCWQAGIPLQIAYSRENPYQLLTEWLPDPDSEHAARHEVERQLALVAATGAPPIVDDGLRITIPDAAHTVARAALAACGIDDSTPWAVLHPGTSAPSRRYPADRFAAAATMLASSHGWRFVVTGSDHERSLAAEVCASIGPNAVSLAGRLSLAEFAAVVEGAPLLITNNTGPAHIAAATGTPAVVLYALTNPQHAPWRAEAGVLAHDVPCRWCFRSICPQGHNACLTGIAPEDVVRAALDLARTTAPELEAVR